MNRDVAARAKVIRHKEIFMTFGDDFRYMKADQNYRSMDNMICYMNENSDGKIRYKYSTPSQYIDALKKYNIQWPVKTDDGFPYSDEPNSYWTGFYTSRPTDKIYIRDISR